MAFNLWMLITSYSGRLSGVVSALLRKLETCLMKLLSAFQHGTMVGKKLISLAVFFPSAPLPLFVNISQLYLLGRLDTINQRQNYKLL